MRGRTPHRGMGWAINNPPPHAARYRAAQAAKARTRGGAGGDCDWRARDDNMGRRGDASKAIPQHPPTPPIEKWDCNIEEEEAAVAAAAANATDEEDDGGEEEEEEENRDTASNDLSWENMQTPPTDYSQRPNLGRRGGGPGGS